MTLVSEADQRRIAEAITEAERTTSGEIVAMIAPQSSSYLHVPFLWAALVALAVPWPFVFWTWWPIQHIYLLQLGVFAALALVLMHPPLRLALVPRSVKHARAHRRAVEQFLAQNLHTAVGRTGVLIFVSVAVGCPVTGSVKRSPPSSSMRSSPSTTLCRRRLPSASCGARRGW